jgi:hypothetical protein
MNSGSPPTNGRGRSAAHQLLAAPGNPETTANKTSQTISAGHNVSKCQEEFTELTEESLARLEQGIWELSLEIVGLRSRIEAYPGLALSNNRLPSKRRCLNGFLQ